MAKFSQGQGQSPCPGPATLFFHDRINFGYPYGKRDLAGVLVVNTEKGAAKTTPQC